MVYQFRWDINMSQQNININEGDGICYDQSVGSLIIKSVGKQVVIKSFHPNSADVEFGLLPFRPYCNLWVLPYANW